MTIHVVWVTSIRPAKGGSRQNNSLNHLKIAQKAIIRHALGVQVQAHRPVEAAASSDTGAAAAARGLTSERF